MGDKGTCGGRSRHAGCPGSITALRVDYGRVTSAFEPQDLDHPATQRRESLKQWKCGPRPAEKQGWNSSVAHANAKFPDRAKMHLLSAHQSIKIEHNFRAQRLPTCYKDSIFVPKRNKFEMDATPFMTENEKGRIVGKNVGSDLSRREYADAEEYVGDGRWDASVLLENERASLHGNTAHPDYRLANKLRVSKANYIPPQKAVAQSNLSLRQAKLQQTQAAQSREAELARAPVTLKNKAQWENLDPVQVALGNQSA